jgi:hypothetical protein
VRNKIISDGSKKTINDLLNRLGKIHMNTIGKNINEIKKWCDQRNLDLEIFVKYIDEYAKFRSLLNRNMTDENINFIKQMQQILGKNVIHNRHTIALLFGFPFNVCKKIKDSDYYLSMYHPLLTNTYKISSLSPYKPKLNSFISIQNMQDYLLYLNINIEFDTITCLHRIDPSLIIMMRNIYPITMSKVPNIEIKMSINKFIKAKEKIYENDNIKNKNAIGPNTQIAAINYGYTLTISKEEMEKSISNENNKIITSLSEMI